VIQASQWKLGERKEMLDLRIIRRGPGRVVGPPPSCRALTTLSAISARISFLVSTFTFALPLNPLDIPGAEPRISTISSPGHSH
jgi:hypothetical protein